MTIEALEQGDCVSRQAVLDLIADYDLSMGQVVRGIHALPPVTPKQKTGKWLYHIIGFRKCSCCGSLWSTDISENILCNYCPRCGAKMEREKDKK